MPRTHVVIPDTQVRPGVPVDHLAWIGEYLVDQFWGDDVAVIHLGDHWDMASLSSYDKGKKQMEGRRYVRDVAAGNEALELITAPANARNARHRETNHHERQWRPEWWLLRGNHENRIQVAMDHDAQLDGLLSFDHLLSPGWQVVPYLEVLPLDGIWYSHYFYQPMTGRPYSGTIDNRLKQVGRSFTMGHQQTKLTGERYVGDQQQRGLIVGACYLHDEDYKGPQGNHHWRGIIVCHEVHDGAYDLMEVSLNWLCHKYEGVWLDQFTPRRFAP